MLFLSIVQHYLLWHYSRAFLEILHVWRNFLWFWIHFFSLPELITNWLAPYKRMVEERHEAWDLEDLAGTVIIGLFSRLVGGLVRTVLIFCGLICLLMTILFGIMVYAFWLAAPVAIITLLTLGISLIIA